MAEHIIQFSKVDDKKYTNPKDKIDWKYKDDNAQSDLHLDKRRMIFINEEAAKKWKHPHVLPEDRWKQESVGGPKKKGKPNFIDHLMEWEDFPEERKPDEDFTVDSQNKLPKIL